MDGPAIASSLYAESDGKLSVLISILAEAFEGSLGLITATGDGRLVVQNVNLNPTKEPISQSGANGNHAHGHLSIPHAIKSMISGSTEHLEKASMYHVKELSTSLSEGRNAGVLIQDERPLGISMRSRDARNLRGIAWFHNEIVVSFFAQIKVFLQRIVAFDRSSILERDQ